MLALSCIKFLHDKNIIVGGNVISRRNLAIYQNVTINKIKEK